MTELETLSTTDSGHVKKKRAMRWWHSLDEPNADELKHTVVPKPNGFTGSKYATDVSQVRITGAAPFIEAVAGLLKPLQDLENDNTRIEIKLQQAENKETGVLTDNYALYLSVAERA